MSTNKRGSNFTFRFNRNEENLLEEILDDESHSLIDSDQSASSSASTPVKAVKSSVSDNSVKDFLTSKLTRGRSLDQPCPTDDVSLSPSSGSKWLNEHWKKIQQMYEEKKEKSAQNARAKEKEKEKEKEREKEKEKEKEKSDNQSSASTSTSDSQLSAILNFAKDSRVIQSDANDDCSPCSPDNEPIDKEISDIPSIETGSQDERISDLKLEERPSSFKDPSFPIIIPKPPTRFHKHSSRRRPSSPLLLSSSPSKPVSSSASTPIELWRIGRTLAKVVYWSSSTSALIAILMTNKLPFPSFMNGFILGIIITLLFIGVLVLYFASKFLFSSDNEIPEIDESLDENCSQSTVSAPPKDINLIDENCVAFKEWFHELVHCQELTSDKLAGDKPKFKTQLVFIRLQGNYLRLSEPHSKNLKSRKLNDNSYTNFVNQRHYDLLNLKRIYLWLPNSVRNRKKYLWVKKYPIVLEIGCTKRGEHDDQDSSKVARLILFARSHRAKEQWYWRFRESARDILLEHSAKNENIECSGDLNDSPPSESSKETIKNKDITQSMLNAECEAYIQNILSHRSSVYMSYVPVDDISHLLWFNAMLGRICFEFLNSQHWANWVTKKIQRKLSRIKLPNFMQTLTVKDIDLGPSLPRFLAIHKRPTLAEDGLWIEFQVDYTGGFAMTLETKLNLMRLKESGNVTTPEKERKEEPKSSSSPSQYASTPIDALDDSSDAESIVPSSDEDENSEFREKLDWDATKFSKIADKIAASKYFQQATDNRYIKKAMEGVSNTPLVLNVVVQELYGILAINFPPPPSDRLWYGFRGQPNLVLSARPRLGDHRVSMSHVIEWIQKKLQEEFCKLLVIPNMDDIVISVMSAHSNVEVQ
ncbi:testis-expressed protein 2 [Brevipalpus obovatus]|uniref:testis-expressed protein 2 n=1 Tax=Brevipalpus obovatus TaxID=246614 RepID=UPI003D9E32A4